MVPFWDAFDSVWGEGVYSIDAIPYATTLKIAKALKQPQQQRLLLKVRDQFRSVLYDLNPHIVFFGLSDAKLRFVGFPDIGWIEMSEFCHGVQQTISYAWLKFVNTTTKQKYPVLAFKNSPNGLALGNYGAEVIGALGRKAQEIWKTSKSDPSKRFTEIILDIPLVDNLSCYWQPEDEK